MKAQKWVVLLLFSPFVFGFSQDNTTLFTQATAYYNQGNYTKAIANYEQILQNGEHSAALYYNLGNCYYKRNATGPAIYYYEKALRLAPNDKEILNNLHYARNMRLDAIEPLPQTRLIQRYHTIVYFFSFDQWAYIALTWIFLGILTYLIYFFLRRTRQKRAAFLVSIFCFMLAAGSMVIAYIQYQDVTNENTAIIFSPEVHVFSEPNSRSEALFTLHEGTKASVLNQWKNWSKIQLANGQTGWLISNNIRLLNDF